MQLVQQGKKKQEHVSHRGPYKAVREQRVKGSPWVSAVTCTQHSHNWGQLQPSPGYPPTVEKTSASMGRGTSYQVLNSCFSSLNFLSRVREVIGTF